MRVALLHPTYWPEVRRGGERLVHDVARALADRGHEPAIVTTHAGPRDDSEEEGVRVVRLPRMPGPPAAARLEDHLQDAPRAARAVLGGSFEMVESFWPAAAAIAARVPGAPPVVLSFTGLPSLASLRARRLRTALVRAAARGATATTVLSDGAARELRDALPGVVPLVLPAAVFCQRFRSDARRCERPTIVSAASTTDRRKHVGLLLRAFARLRESRPEARLVLVGDAPGEAALPPGVETVPARDTAGLARAYAEAWASVLPSVEEAFGLVLVESLAAGTPAVAARSGAAPEILDDERVGRLFAPHDEGALALALEDALELSARPETRAACRAHAARWDWGRQIDRREELYESVARARGSAPYARAA